MVDQKRRRLLGLGGAALLAGLAGCSFFDDTTGVPGRSETNGESEETLDSETNAFGPSA